MTAQARAALDADLATLHAFLTPDRWTRKNYAVNDAGNRCRPESKRATRFCVLGACRRLNGPDSHVLGCLDHRAYRVYDRFTLAQVNDELGYDAVIALLHPVTDAEAG